MAKASQVDDAEIPRGIPFRTFIERNKDNLQQSLYVCASLEEDILAGDVICVQNISERYEAEYEDPKTNRKRRITIPFDVGGFRPVLEHPQNRVYTSFQEIALDFPPSVRALDDVRIQDTVVRKGEGLQLVRLQIISKNHYVLCQHMPYKRPLLVPLDLTGRFQRDIEYTVEELRTRMPVDVKLELGVCDAIRRQSYKDLGIPEGVIMSLTISTVMQVKYLSQPTKAKLCTCKILKVNLDIHVAPGRKFIIGPYQNFNDWMTPYPAVGVVVRNDNYNKELPKDKMYVMHGWETKEGVVVKGKTSYLLIPKDYDEATHFRMRGKEYQTPLDLWKSSYTGKVTAWTTVKSPEGFQGTVQSIYRMDEVHLIRRPDEQELQRMISSNDVDELEVVNVSRKFSSALARLGDISVDSTAKVRFEEQPPIVGDHSLVNILKFGELPIDIAVCHTSDSQLGDNISESEMILMRESPFKVLQQCNYKVTHMTTYEPNSNHADGEKHRAEEFEVPNFVEEVEMLLIKDTFPAPAHFENPKSRVHKLSPRAYYRLTGEPFPRATSRSQSSDDRTTSEHQTVSDDQLYRLDQSRGDPLITHLHQATLYLDDRFPFRFPVP